MTYSALGVDVRDISSNTWRASDIEESKLADARVELEEKRQGLANPTAGTEHSDLGELSHRNVSRMRLVVVVQWTVGSGWGRAHVTGGGGESSPLCGAEDGLGDLTSGEHDGRCM